MAPLQRCFYEAPGKMFLLLFLIFLSCDVIAYDSSSLEDFSSSNSEESKRISDQGDGYGYYHRYRNVDDAMVKRALTLLAHWKPHYVGMSGINTRSDIVTRGGHARPLGQPLRWG